jgi:hypothetical protein
MAQTALRPGQLLRCALRRHATAPPWPGTDARTGSLTALETDSRNREKRWRARPQHRTSAHRGESTARELGWIADGVDRWALSWGMDREARPWKADYGRARPASRKEQKMTSKQTALGKKLVSRIRSRPWTTLPRPGQARPDLRKRREVGEQGELTAEERLDRPGTTRPGTTREQSPEQGDKGELRGRPR